ncbi:unnamed protein product [Chrysoparadoxa australica]
MRMWTQALVASARRGDGACVRALLEAGADAQDRAVWSGQVAPVLRIAISLGRADAVKFLLEHGSDVAEKMNGWSALLQSTYIGNAVFLQALIKAGAEINAVSPAGRSPLHHAAYN